MKVSLNWLKDYLPISSSNEEISEILTSLGLEVSSISQGKSFSGVVLGKITQCKPHKNADKLSVCEVDIGGDSTDSIVCGAPNVKKDILVPVAKVGATLQNGEYKIKKAKLRGVESNGMICSGKELGINDDHNGIMELFTKEKLGTSIEEILNINDDVIFEIDLTPNRGDCLSHLGVARELGIFYNKKLQKRKIFTTNENESNIDNFKINIESSESCLRYAARIIKKIKVGPSPKWLSDRLNSLGLSSINNIVDAANFVLMDSGHPLHTFDLDKINGKTINVRFAKEGEYFTTLDNVKRKLNDFNLLICDNQKPIALAGIMGGVNSEIKNDTQNILIESAYFDPAIIRKGAKKLDLSTDASRRFERDTDIEGVITALNQLTQLIVDIAGGTVSKGILDHYVKKKKNNIILFSLERCEKLLGIKLEYNEIKKIFNSLNIDCINNGKELQCSIPTYRNDLEREVDLFEEVARIIGYDNIPSAQKFSASYSSFIDDDHKLDTHIRSHLCANGFYEHYSNSLHNEIFINHFAVGKAIKIKNPLSQDMSNIRNSILPGLLIAASYNEKRQQKYFKLFEIGAIHNESKKSYTRSNEKFQLGLIWYGSENLHWRNFEDRDIYRFKGEIISLLRSVRLKNISFKISNEKGFKTSLKIYSGKASIGFIGTPDKLILKDYDLDQTPIVCDISLNSICDLCDNNEIVYKAATPYPSITRDISLQVKNDIFAQNLLNTIWKNGGKTLVDVSLFDIYQSDDVGNKNKSLAFSLKFQSDHSTLTDIEIDKELELILKSLKELYGAIQR